MPFIVEGVANSGTVPRVEWMGEGGGGVIEVSMTRVQNKCC